MVKYADRGLANDRYYYNMNRTLFKLLFWTTNISLFAINQGMTWGFTLKHEGNYFPKNSYRQVKNVLDIRITDFVIHLEV